MNKDTTHDPLESFAQLFFDSVVFDPDALKLLVGKAGAEKVLLGSDYPFPIGDLEPRTVIGEMDVPVADKAQIEGGNAQRMFAGVTT